MAQLVSIIMIRIPFVADLNITFLFDELNVLLINISTCCLFLNPICVCVYNYT